MHTAARSQRRRRSSGGGREGRGNLKHGQLLKPWGWGTREKEIISKVNRNAFKHKQTKHLRSRIMTGMDAKISIIPLRILMGNICQACTAGGGQRLSGNCFLAPAGLERPHPTLAWATHIPLLLISQVPKAWQEHLSGVWVQGEPVSTYTLSDGAAPAEPTGEILNGNQLCRSRKVHLTAHKGFTNP